MLMRGFGIAAFQVDLLPQLNAATIKRLNAGAIARAAGIDARAEIERVLQVSDADIVDGSHRIHKADNPFSVAVNVRQWNTEILHPPSAAMWGRRRVSYFAYDHASGLFAPSKFCAFVPTVKMAAAAKRPEILQRRPAGMTMSIYAMLDESDPRFDGRIAWKHLHSVLGYDVVEIQRASDSVRTRFDCWQRRLAGVVQVRSPVVLLMPPLREQAGPR
ncbi:MAG: hypothetical protein E6H79_17760 [Betaproteobacteria bacterium]|nr:MAG: hypothetical protein E6H79_17760 [Betaproteobacteria bacterium]